MIKNKITGYLSLLIIAALLISSALVMLDMGVEDISGLTIIFVAGLGIIVYLLVSLAWSYFRK